MRVNSLKLKNFRNYSELEVEFDCKRNIIIGENAQGKTNLIEAIYLRVCAFFSYEQFYGSHQDWRGEL
mgnify:CR=1 FL=1